jgi:hypothetical protein
MRGSKRQDPLSAARRKRRADHETGGAGKVKIRLTRPGDGPKPEPHAKPVAPVFIVGRAQWVCGWTASF